jgi:hypothetical protein
MEHRTNLVVKYLYLLTNILAIIAFNANLGVQPKDVITSTSSSITTVIGVVAIFAQWSNFKQYNFRYYFIFSFPFKIGDAIRIHDKIFLSCGN